MPGEDPSNAFRSREDVGAFATWCNFGVNNKYFNDSMVDEVGDPFFTSLTDDGTAQIQVRSMGVCRSCSCITSRRMLLLLLFWWCWWWWWWWGSDVDVGP